MRAVALLIALATVCATPECSASPSPCADAFARGTVCAAAGEEAQRLFAARNVAGAIVIEDVATGAVVGIGEHNATDGPVGAAPLTVAAPILPLSVAKLFLAASVCTHETDLGSSPEVLEAALGRIIVNSDDKAGREWASILRQRVGTAVALDDLSRYGVRHCATAQHEPDRTFWSTPAPKELVPERPCALLDEKTADKAWADAFSLGEANFSLSLLHLVRFAQGIANDGVMIAPSYSTSGGLREPSSQSPIMPKAVAAKLQAAMMATVTAGTAKGANGRLKGTWRLAGKTGTSNIFGTPFDGIFVGFAADPSGEARYAFAIYVRRGGFGGGAAAEIVSDVFNYALGLGAH